MDWNALADQWLQKCPFKAMAVDTPKPRFHENFHSSLLLNDSTFDLIKSKDAIVLLFLTFGVLTMLFPPHSNFLLDALFWLGSALGNLGGEVFNGLTPCCVPGGLLDFRLVFTVFSEGILCSLVHKGVNHVVVVKDCRQTLRNITSFVLTTQRVFRSKVSNQVSYRTLLKL